MASPDTELQQAAAKLRKIAKHTTGGTWAVPDVIDMVVSDKVMPWGTPVIAECGTPEDADWIALMTPALAEPLAALLDDTASDMAVERLARPENAQQENALAIARQINGAAS